MATNSGPLTDEDVVGIRFEMKTFYLPAQHLPSYLRKTADEFFESDLKKRTPMRGPTQIPMNASLSECIGRMLSEDVMWDVRKLIAALLGLHPCDLDDEYGHVDNGSFTNEKNPSPRVVPGTGVFVYEHTRNVLKTVAFRLEANMCTSYADLVLWDSQWTDRIDSKNKDVFLQQWARNAKSAVAELSAAQDWIRDPTRLSTWLHDRHVPHHIEHTFESSQPCYDKSLQAPERVVFCVFRAEISHTALVAADMQERAKQMTKNYFDYLVSSFTSQKREREG